MSLAADTIRCKGPGGALTPRGVANLMKQADMTQGTDRVCVQCGRGFRGQTRKCAPCQGVERQCSTCGEMFTGRYRQCDGCRRPPRSCLVPGCANPKLPGQGSKVCQQHRDDAYERKLQKLREQNRLGNGICHMPECAEPKLAGRGHLYCTQHSADAVKSSPTYRQRASILQVRRIRERTLGVTHEEFTALLDAQGGVCAICGNGNDGGRQLSIDHDHATGAIRGLLCYRCNPMLGYARDNIVVLQAAIEYLERHSGMD